MNNALSEYNNEKTEHSYLLFGLGEKVYGLDVSNVLEVIKLQFLDVPQRLPKNILGVITYNELTINIVDLRMVLSLPIVPYALDAQIIIVKTAESIFGVIADKAMDVFVFDSSKMHTLPYHSEDNLIKFFYQNENDFASIIDLDSVESILQKTQFEQNNIDVASLFPRDEESLQELKQRQVQLSEKKLPAFKEVFWSNSQYIVFSLEDNFYAIDIGYVREIVDFNSISVVKLPLKYDYLEGIFNSKGAFISILNLKKFLLIENSHGCSESGKLVVLDLKDFKLAIWVDDIINIVTVSNQDIVGKNVGKFDSKYNLAELYIDEKVVSVLHLEKILSDEKLYIQG